MKKILLILTCFLLLGCSNKSLQYKQVSDEVIYYLKNGSYRQNKLSKDQKELLDSFINPKININKFLIKEKEYQTNLPNTQGVFVEDGLCYIRLSDIVFSLEDSANLEPRAKIVCNGYQIYLFEDAINNNADYDFNYRFLGYYKDTDYHFVYRSYENGSQIAVNIGTQITISDANLENIKLKMIKVKKTNYVFISLVVTGFIILFLWIKKQHRH